MTKATEGYDVSGSVPLGVGHRFPFEGKVILQIGPDGSTARLIILTPHQAKNLAASLEAKATAVEQRPPGIYDPDIETIYCIDGEEVTVRKSG